MNRLAVQSRIDRDGILRLNIPVGVQDAGRAVQVIVEPAESKPTIVAEDYTTWLKSVAGQWQGPWERPEQGTLEEREPLP